MELIDTVRGLVVALGGTRAVARYCLRSPQAVSMWISAGEIPPGHHLRLFLLAQAHGLSVHERVFGLPEGALDLVLHRTHEAA